MIGKIREMWRARNARKARDKRLGDVALAASDHKYSEEETIWSPWILEDDAGVVICLFYRSETIPPRRRFWQISGQEAEEVDGRSVTSRFQLGPYR